MIILRWLIYILLGFWLDLLVGYVLMPLFALLYWFPFVRPKLKAAISPDVKYVEPEPEHEDFAEIVEDSHGPMSLIPYFEWAHSEGKLIVEEIQGILISYVDQNIWTLKRNCWWTRKEKNLSKDAVSFMAFAVARWGLPKEYLRELEKTFYKHIFSFPTVDEPKNSPSVRNNTSGFNYYADADAFIGPPITGVEFWCAHAWLCIFSSALGGWKRTLALRLHYFLRGGPTWSLIPFIAHKPSAWRYNYRVVASAIAACRECLSKKVVAKYPPGTYQINAKILWDTGETEVYMKNEKYDGPMFEFKAPWHIRYPLKRLSIDCEYSNPYVDALNGKEITKAYDKWLSGALNRFSLSHMNNKTGKDEIMSVYDGLIGLKPLQKHSRRFV